MSCHIASYANRSYAALEAELGAVAAMTSSHRLPLSKLDIRSVREASQRLDKSGGRTFVGVPHNGREHTTIEFSSYLTGWDSMSGVPELDAAVQAVMGGEVQANAPNAITDVSGGLTVTMSAPHGLSVGQAIAIGSEIRFVDSVLDDHTVVVNCPMPAGTGGGTGVGRCVTYRLGSHLKSLTIYDYWDPSTAIQRCAAGVSVDQLVVSVNGDFHEMVFSGEGSGYYDSASELPSSSGLQEFPSEPVGEWATGELIPGSIGRAWIGTGGEACSNVLVGKLAMNNHIDYRRREFGGLRGGCVRAGIRDVRLDLRIRAENSDEARSLFSASRLQQPVPVMFQLGESSGRMCAMYLPQVVMEVPVFDDSGPSLEWIIRQARAQGVYNDELIVAFG
ncbi:MAG: hypothetical protein IPJ98_08440 [Bryobacterales bacterium]|nr:hypothetical protein [Bryobacterales bacterium]